WSTNANSENFIFVDTELEPEIGPDDLVDRRNRIIRWNHRIIKDGLSPQRADCCSHSRAPECLRGACHANKQSEVNKLLALGIFKSAENIRFNNRRPLVWTHSVQH